MSQILFYQTCLISMMGMRPTTGTKWCRRVEDTAWRGNDWKATQRRVWGHQKIDSNSATSAASEWFWERSCWMEAENFATTLTLELHKKQFGLLLHVVSAISFRGMFVTAKFPTFWSTSYKCNLLLVVKLKFRLVCRRKGTAA